VVSAKVNQRECLPVVEEVAEGACAIDRRTNDVVVARTDRFVRTRWKKSAEGRLLG
jgi:hypothetical protein